MSQAQAKLNELAKALPEVLANIDPKTKGRIEKVNGIVNDVCAQVIAGFKPTAYSPNITPQGLKETCDYIAKIGEDILAGMDNPAIFQKYTSDLNGIVTALNAKAADITL